MVFKRAGNIVGLLPMVACKERVLGRPLVSLSPLSERYNTHSDVLTALDTDSCARALLSALSQLDIQWDIFRMGRLLETLPLIDSLAKHAAHAGKAHISQFEPPSFFLQLPDSFENYLAQRSGKFRNYLRRVEKKLMVLGDVQFVDLAALADFDAAYEHILDIEKHSWKHEHGTAISAITRQAAFYRDMGRAAMETGRLHLSFLSLKGEPIVYNLGYLHNNQYYYLKTSYREQFRAHGVATYARAKLVESLIGKGVRAFDFPGEPYEWEQQWTSELRWHKSISIYNDTLRARTYSALWRLRRLLRRRRADKVLEFCDAKDLQPPSN
jgi:CelD/BcsL family acetyltransferase involved in cellulose biosynthesis